MIPKWTAPKQLYGCHVAIDCMLSFATLNASFFRKFLRLATMNTGTKMIWWKKKQASKWPCALECRYRGSKTSASIWTTPKRGCQNAYLTFGIEQSDRTHVSKSIRTSQSGQPRKVKSRLSAQIWTYRVQSFFMLKKSSVEVVRNSYDNPYWIQWLKPFQNLILILTILVFFNSGFHGWFKGTYRLHTERWPCLVFMMIYTVFSYLLIRSQCNK